MLSRVRLAGLMLCLLVLLTTCSAPLGNDHSARLSGFVAGPGESGAAQGSAGEPTVLPSVTPLAQAGDSGSVPALQSTPALSVPAESSGLSAVLNSVPTPTLAPEMVAVAGNMDAYLQSLVDEGSFSGAVLVAYQGQVLLSKGYGMANAEQGIIATSTTRFRLASVSKSITALAVMQLVGAGLINLDASICTYLPNCPEAWKPVLVRHLLTHTSGIANYTDFAAFADVEQLPASPDQVIDRFRDLPLGFEPGSLYQYCNSNFVLLGQIIEQVSGQPYDAYMHDWIFGPLGMINSGYDSGDASVLGGTRGYVGAGTPAIPINTSNLFAAGGIYSTVEDLYRLAQALDAGHMMKPELAAQMFTPFYYGYGFGWKIENRYGRQVIYHPGEMSGAHTYFGRYPNDGLTVIVLSNNEYTNATATGEYLAGMIFG